MDQHIKIVAGKEISYDMISQALQLDRISYEDIYQLELNTCYEFFDKNPDIYIMAIDEMTQKVVGYINYSPVTERIAKLMIDGEIIDSTFTKDDIVAYQDGKTCHGYFSSIVVHPAYRRHGIATKMLWHWVELVCYLANERRIYFREVIADAVSDAGMHLLTKMGFSEINPSQHNSRIMSLNLFSEKLVGIELTERILDVYSKREKE